ncbi:MAG: ABC transporter ATP-binding protein [Clostridiales bacterium]|nr:ABC transporter ATP-binding protein [Clostridiales bacterium]
MPKKHGVLYNIRQFLPYYKPHLRVLTFDLLCAVLTTACELIFPLIVSFITDQAIAAPASITLSFVLRPALLYVGLRLIDAGAYYYMQSRGHIMGARIETDMRTNLFNHLQQLSFSYYNNAKIGQLMSRMTSDLFDVTEFSHHCPEEFLIALVKISVSFIILLGVNVPLTLLIFLMLPFLLYATYKFNTRIRRTFAAGRWQLGEINAQTEDSLLGMRVVQSFANEHLENEKFGLGNQKFLRLKIKQYRIMAGFHITTRLMDGIMNILVVVAGAIYLGQGQITAGQYLSYLLYVNMLLAAIRRLVEFTEQFQRGMTGIERFQEVMDAPLEITDTPGAQELTDVKGEIHFDDVSFHYADAEDSPVLDNLTLTVSAGQNVALVGPSGSGKTTLCNLIPRFYDVTAGRILIDGQDIKGLTLKSLRSNIGMVQQDVYLFSGTVYDNIAYGKPGADRAQVEAAARRAGAHDFIQELPDGYDTYVGERGVKLSGGQKQRISIARVFLKDPPILLLDEATSALDNESERLVQQSLEALTRGRTTLTIAHRLTTIRGADVIWVLTENGLEEHGTHSELMRKGGLYSRLYQMYAAGTAQEEAAALT